MIQGGDPLGNGTGSVDVVKDEFKNGLIFDVPGRVAMAQAGPGTASSQFFITERDTPQLNGDYTIFGQVVEGQELVPKSPTRRAGLRPAQHHRPHGEGHHRTRGCGAGLHRCRPPSP